MQWSAASVVSSVQIYTSQLKEVYRNRLIPLGGHMEHVDAEVVFGVDICTLIYEQFAYLRISFERPEMKGSETIPMVFHIYPRCHLRGSKLSACILQKFFQTGHTIVEGAIMKKRFAICIDDLIHH